MPGQDSCVVRASRPGRDNDVDRTSRPRERLLTRRQFLKAGAVAAAGAPYLVSSSAWGGPPPSGRITAAVVGVGGRGGYILGHLLGRKDVQVVAICDVDRGHRDRAVKRVRDRYARRAKDGSFRGVEGYNHFREVTSRDDIDVVAIGTPDHTHALVSIAALSSGKDVFVEKPMTLAINEGRAMAEAVERYGRILQVGNQRRSDGGIRRTCELVRNGRIGRLQTVKVGCGSRPKSPQAWEPLPVPEGFDYDLWLGPAPWAPYTKKRCHYNFRFVRDYSGGEMTNFGAHFLDVAQWGIGADDTGPVEIEGEGKAHPTGLYDVFYRFRVVYTYANGVKIVCTSGGQGVKFVGTEGWISGPGRGSSASMLRSKIGPDEIHLYEARGGHLGCFLDCVRTRKDPSSPVETGHRTASLCHLGNIAMALGRKLKWDPVEEEFPGDDEANRMRSRPYREPWRLSV